MSAACEHKRRFGDKGTYAKGTVTAECVRCGGTFTVGEAGRECPKVRPLGVLKVGTGARKHLGIDGVPMGYPTGVGAKVRPAFDEVRRMLDGLRLGCWNLADGVFSVTFDDGRDGFRGPVAELPAWVDEVRPGWRDAPKVAKVPAVKRPTVAPSAPVVAVEAPAVVPAPSVPEVRVSAAETVKAPAAVVSNACPDGCGLPEPVCEYLARLIHPPKAEYARRYVVARLEGGELPKDPGAPWADKVRVKVDRLVKV